MIIDLLLVGTVIGVVTMGWFRGALRMVAGLFVATISFVVAGLLTSRVTELLTTLLVSDSSRAQMVNKVVTSQQNQQSTNQILSDLGIVPQLQQNLIVHAQPSSSVPEQFAKSLVDGIAHNFIGILVFIFLFIAINFGLNLFLNSASSFLNKMPLVGFANRMVGAGIGLIYAYLLCVLIVAVVSGVSPFFSQLNMQTKSSLLYPIVTSPSFTAWIYNKLFQLGNLLT